MSQSIKQRVIDWLYQQPFRTGLHDFADLVSEATAATLGWDSESVESFVESRSRQLWNDLRAFQEQRSHEGISPVFEMFEGTSKCRWFCATPTADRIEARRRLKLKSRPEIISAIEGMTWRQYEALGCVVSKFCGAAQVALTPPGNECGIDFFAVVRTNGNNHIFSGSGASLKVVGQSKKYGSRIEVEKVKSFYDVLTDIHKHEPKVMALVPSWFQQAKGPVIGWMVSHRGFQSGAKTRARNHGILASDTIDLAEIAALSRAIPECEQPSIRALHLVSTADSYLA